MTKKCGYCGGSRERTPEGGVLTLGGEHCCCRAVFEKSIQKEALESAAKMLVERARDWAACSDALASGRAETFCAAAQMVRTHDPSAKPPQPKPKVSRRSLHVALDPWWADSARYLNLNQIRERVYELLGEVLDLTDEP